MKWFEEHYIVSCIILLTFTSLFTAVTLKVFFDPVEIPGTGSTTGAYATFFGLPTIIVGLLKWRASRVDDTID